VDIGLAEVAVDRGRHESALEHVGEALELLRASHATYYEPWAWTVAMRAHHASGEAENALLCARRALAVLGAAPPGEVVRLAMELATVAVGLHDLTSAARLLGAAAAIPDRRELPFPSPAEATRRDETEKTVVEGLGTEAPRHTAAGRRCSVAEAAGDLLGS
jgi:hypothetical protein